MGSSIEPSRVNNVDMNVDEDREGDKGRARVGGKDIDGGIDGNEIRYRARAGGREGL